MRPKKEADSAIDSLGQAQRILIMTHIAPDGDAIGSLLGLGWALRALGKVCFFSCADQVPPIYLFLPGSGEIQARRPRGDEDLIVVLDSSDLSRLGEVWESSALGKMPILNIDHHVTNLGFGTINWIDGTAAATAEMVWEIVLGLGVAADRDIATCLLTALVEDTRGFRTASVTPQTLHIAARLMALGAPLAEIVGRLFNNRSLGDLRLWGKALERIQCQRGLIWTEITLGMRDECGASQDDGSGVANFLLELDGAVVAAVFKERGRGLVEVSLRSRPDFDVSPVATRFGGGGHLQASGLMMAGGLASVRQKVLAALEEALDGEGLGSDGR